MSIDLPAAALSAMIGGTSAPIRPMPAASLASIPAAVAGTLRPGMAASVSQLTKPEFTMEKLVEYLVQEPDAGVEKVARHFKLSPRFVATMMQTDAFKTRMAMLTEETARNSRDLAQVLAATALLAAEKLAEKVAQVEDPEVLLQIVDKSAARLGMGQPKPGGGIHLNINNNNEQVPSLTAQRRAEIVDMYRERQRAAITIDQPPAQNA